jgi:flavin reductase (DIM6/NTAB) family NADH-FMN oxidoreductase RutF
MGVAEILTRDSSAPVHDADQTGSVARAREQLLAPARMDGDAYRSIARQWLTGVAIVTSRNADGAPVGLTMSAVTPLSLAPPMFLICLDLGSGTLLAIEATKSFAINFIGTKGAAVCKSFAKKGGDKFTGVTSRIGEVGVPILDEAIAHVECVLHDTFVAGDHKIIIGLAVSGDVSEGEPLAYFRGAFQQLGP